MIRLNSHYYEIQQETMKASLDLKEIMEVILLFSFTHQPRYFMIYYVSLSMKLCRFFAQITGLTSMIIYYNLCSLFLFYRKQ